MKLHVKDLSVSEVITTVGGVNVTVKANAKEETSGSPVVAVVSALSVCVAVAVVGSAIFIRYRKKTNAAEEDPADAPYANIHTQESACLPSDLYSYAECEI
ncbi:hypothetical protein SKAU_G00221060 [Synaphobranchus kaupii]|uniref:Uncharacterized protein n=1 Tax=Synaphobranchus kaupii TaxID=118154 RepID=A0A9Q1FAS4_SYNKA|nr:hypothetical protein SKAU_G00221060 [Synaphobranchus kaupii]